MSEDADVIRKEVIPVDVQNMSQSSKILLTNLSLIVNWQLNQENTHHLFRTFLLIMAIKNRVIPHDFSSSVNSQTRTFLAILECQFDYLEYF